MRIDRLVVLVVFQILTVVQDTIPIVGLRRFQHLPHEIAILLKFAGRSWSVGAVNVPPKRQFMIPDLAQNLPLFQMLDSNLEFGGTFYLNKELVSRCSLEKAPQAIQYQLNRETARRLLARPFLTLWVGDFAFCVPVTSSLRFTDETSDSGAENDEHGA